MTSPFILPNGNKKSRKPQHQGRRTDTRAAAFFLLPSFFGVCVFVLAPFAETVRRSFTDTLGQKSVGFANYAAVVQNAAFQLAAANTVRFLSICVPLLLLASLVLALLVRRA
ncbi:MAG: hypothetical protein RSC58_01830, partial [Ruthenibacterium sp.]